MQTADSFLSGLAVPDTLHLPSQTPKPTTSEAEVQHPKSSRGVKRRAPQACQSCRVRKVRCNVAKHGTPCANCQVDDLVCEVAESKRKKKRTTDETSAGPEGNHTVALPPLAEASSAGATQEPLPPPCAHTGTAPFDIGYSVQLPAQTKAPSREDPPLAHVLTSPATQPPSALPAYIKPLPNRFEPEDITYLQQKGALAIPDYELRNELLRRYVEYMHPFMPLLNWHEFVQIIHRNDEAQSVSLLLFQAVMFSGVAHADMRLLEAAGYSSRREARRAFYNKIRLLYDLDYEDDPIALVQALLLMTYWRERPNGRKETLHWVEIAVSLAQKIGLHRNTEDDVGQPQRYRFWKRIWWSAYVRDAQIALGSRKSTCIKDVDWKVPMLEMADFELDTIHSVPSYISTDCEVVPDGEKQRQLATMCIANAKLSLCIAYILSVHHGVTSSKGSIQTAAMLFANPPEPDDDCKYAGAKALEQWQDGLPDEAQYVTPTMHDVVSRNSCLVVNRAFLHMTYYTALSALHRPQLQHSNRGLPHAARPTAASKSHKFVELSATSITSIAGTLQSLNLVRYLPSPTITVLLPAIVFHLLDTLAPERFISPTSLQNFGRCMQIMGELREMYAAADYSTAFLQAAIQRTEIGPVAAQTDQDGEERCAIATGQDLATNGMPPRSSALELGHMAPPAADQTTNVTTQQTNGSAQAPNNLVTNDDNGRRLTNPLPISADLPSDRLPNHIQQPDFLPFRPEALVFDAADVANDSSTSPNMNTASNGAVVVDSLHDFELESEGNATSLCAVGDTFNLDNGGDFGGLHGANEAFGLDMDWIHADWGEGLSSF